MFENLPDSCDEQWLRLSEEFRYRVLMRWWGVNNDPKDHLIAEFAKARTLACVLELNPTGNWGTGSMRDSGLSRARSRLRNLLSSGSGKSTTESTSSVRKGS